jgi:uncharacterized protein DUF3313
MRNRTSSELFYPDMIRLTIAGLLAGCGQTSDGLIQPGEIIGGGTIEIRDVRPVGGFLPNTSLLRPGASGQPDLFYRNPAANFSSYSKVMLDPVMIWAPPDSNLNSVPPDQRQALADSFHSDLYNALKKRCRIVTSPSPGTVRLRYALVDAKIPNAIINTIATYAPYASSAYSLASFAFDNGVGYFAGTATTEGYAIDATDGMLLWEAVDKRGGTTALLENTLNTWLDIDHAFTAWSDRLASRMQDLGACRK